MFSCGRTDRQLNEQLKTVQPFFQGKICRGVFVRVGAHYLLTIKGPQDRNKGGWTFRSNAHSPSFTQDWPLLGVTKVSCKENKVSCDGWSYLSSSYLSSHILDSCNCNSKVSDALFWPWWVLHAYDAYTHTQVHMDIKLIHPFSKFTRQRKFQSKTWWKEIGSGVYNKYTVRIRQKLDMFPCVQRPMGQIDFI